MKWYRNIQGRPTHRRPFVLSEKEVAILADLAVQQNTTLPYINLKGEKK